MVPFPTKMIWKKLVVRVKPGVFRVNDAPSLSWVFPLHSRGMSYVVHEWVDMTLVCYHPDESHEIEIKWSKGTTKKKIEASWDNGMFFHKNLDVRVIGDCLGLFVGDTEFYCDKAPASLLELLEK